MRQEKSSSKGQGLSIGLSEGDRAEIRELVSSWWRGSAVRGPGFRRDPQRDHREGALGLRTGDPSLTGKAADQSEYSRRKALLLIAKDVDVWIIALMIVALGVLGRP